MLKRLRTQGTKVLFGCLAGALALTLLTASAPPPTPLDPLMPAPHNAECCKVCHKGKACGDSCISRDKQCHKGPGCACDG